MAVLMLPLLVAATLVILDVASTVGARAHAQELTVIAAQRAALVLANDPSAAQRNASVLLHRVFPDSTVGLKRVSVAGIPMVKISVRVTVSSLISLASAHTFVTSAHAPLEIP